MSKKKKKKKAVKNEDSMFISDSDDDEKALKSVTKHVDSIVHGKVVIYPLMIEDYFLLFIILYIPGQLTNLIIICNQQSET